MELKFIYRLQKLFEQWKKTDSPIDRFYIMDEIDTLIKTELAKLAKVDNA